VPIPTEWLIGPFALRAALLVAMSAGATGVWRWGREVEREAARADRAERQRDRALDALLQAVQTNRLAQETTQEAVQAVRTTAAIMADAPGAGPMGGGG
jgi:hypothetical protein